jgi:hypothetical protein
MARLRAVCGFGKITNRQNKQHDRRNRQHDQNQNESQNGKAR